MPPYERLELSSAVKVRTHQFSAPKFRRVLDSAVCVFYSPHPFFFLWEKGESGADRIRPLGVTVLSGIRPATLLRPPHTHTQTRNQSHCNKMVSRRGIYCWGALAWPGSARHREGLVLRRVHLLWDG